MQITPSIEAIRTPLGPAKDRFVYVYLVYGDGITVIDTGMAGSDQLILGAIRSAGRDPAEIRLIVLTHHHPDHTGSAKTLRDLTGCTIAAHPLDRQAIEQPDPALLRSPAPGVPPFVSGPVPVDRPLQDGDRIDAGAGLVLEVLHTPGHTPGSIALLIGHEKALFTGDAIQAPGRMPIFADPVALVRSLRRLRALTGIERCLPAHDEPAQGAESYRRLDASIAHLRRFHAAVKEAAAGAGGAPDYMRIAAAVPALLGISPLPAPPLPDLAQAVRADLEATGLDEELAE